MEQYERLEEQTEVRRQRTELGAGSVVDGRRRTTSQCNLLLHIIIIMTRTRDFMTLKLLKYVCIIALKYLKNMLLKYVLKKVIFKT